MKAFHQSSRYVLQMSLIDRGGVVSGGAVGGREVLTGYFNSHPL